MALKVVELTKVGRVGVILVNRPPVNAIDVEVRRGVLDAVSAAQGDPEIHALVLACEGRTFMSGADLTEFDTGVAEPDFRQTLAAVEQSGKPIVASMHGTVLGGGLEIAMACHYRVAQPTTKHGLPEITLGVIPGAGGTQRLPRLIGALPALAAMISAVPLDADAALANGLIDDADQISQFVDLHRIVGHVPRHDICRQRNVIDKFILSGVH